ncbi:hypothetical protein BofuT4_uP138660.1 [Botrytis cinerea T4]|uniref:Uncharacterized protein n=1 Tax=Botryotinia fuckeliana (strain T4) TaxID=999810 RepID=G2YMU4_BOTF4|nr:hypothetical protein BofuT4_uP138660.1 [Botrytis cinerea T4]
MMMTRECMETAHRVGHLGIITCAGTTGDSVAVQQHYTTPHYTTPKRNITAATQARNKTRQVNNYTSH